MKIKIALLAVCLLAFASIGLAQKKKTTVAVAADQVVKNLYAAHKSEKTSPFFQTKNRALVDKYFAKDLAAAIWKDAVDAKGDVGTIDFDPLYGSQDPKITNLVVGKPKEDSGPDDVYVKVTFKDNGKAASAGFNLRREANKVWKIYNIDYSSGDDLTSILEYWTDEESKKAHDAKTFKGDYMVGAMQCSVSPTLSSIELYRVTCDGQEGFKLYAVDGNETETAYIYTDDKGKNQRKFVFKKGAEDGTFVDAAGKEVKVTRVKTSSETTTGDSENETVSGELRVGKTQSVILYVGMETGDYAAYCFMNASEAGRAILAACKNKDQCEVKATLGDGGTECKVPGLEANLSASFNIAKVASVKSLGPRR